MPYLERHIIQERLHDFISDNKKADYFASTGGSTAEPIKVPCWSSESIVAKQNLLFARSWFGIYPFDKLFLIWGHSHLLGKGARGFINSYLRIIKDYLLGYKRFSAYDLSEAKLGEAADELINFKPEYIVSYSVALDRFARVNKDRKKEFHKLDLKAAIATAESFPRSNSEESISDILGCPVVMEYGAVETGLIAHHDLDHKFRVFWKDYYIEGIKSPELSDCYEIVVTSLYPRCLPLIRYKLGDLIISKSYDDMNLKFDKVIGRCNDFIELTDNSLIHSEAFTHVVKEFQKILGYQVIQLNKNKINLNYVSKDQLSNDEILGMREKLKKINPYLENIDINQVEKLEQTVAGKTKSIIRV